MKETSGEFTMTLVVIVGAIAVVTLLTQVIVPLAQNYITDRWADIDNKV